MCGYIRALTWEIVTTADSVGEHCTHMRLQTEHEAATQIRASIAGVFSVPLLLIYCGIVAVVYVCTMVARFTSKFRTNAGIMNYMSVCHPSKKTSYNLCFDIMASVLRRTTK